MRQLTKFASVVLALSVSSIGCASNTKAASPFVEACGAAYRDAAGKAHGFLLPQLSKSLASQPEFTLPSDAPESIVGIQCGRQSLVPLISDFKVLAAGYTFTIVSGERFGRLEIVDGHVRFQMLSGEMTEIEVEQIGKLLDEGQSLLLQWGTQHGVPMSKKPAP